MTIKYIVKLDVLPDSVQELPEPSHPVDLTESSKRQREFYVNMVKRDPTIVFPLWVKRFYGIH